MKKGGAVLRPGQLISAIGSAVLAGGFIFWSFRFKFGIVEWLSALALLLLFWLVCLRFVPRWMEEWTAPASVWALHVPIGGEPKYMGIKIFSLLLLLDLGILLGAWLIRYLAGVHVSFPESLRFWLYIDSRHYMDIAGQGYLATGEVERLVQLVFLPGYPLVVRALAEVIGSELCAGLVISALSFAGAGVVIYRLFRLDYSHTVALRALEFLCLMPGVFFFAAPMSESLFLLLCVMALYMARKEKWLLAGLCGGYASFTRSLGLTILAPLLLEAVKQFAADREAGASKRKLRFGRRVFSLLLIPAGFALYLWINYLVSGNAFKFLEYQREHWDQGLDWFFNTASYLSLIFPIYLRDSNYEMLLGNNIPNLIAVFGSLILLLPSAKKLPAAYTAWFILYYATAVGVTWLLSGPRYLMLMPALWLSAALLTETKKRHIILSTICSVLSAAYFAAFLMKMQVW